MYTPLDASCCAEEYSTPIRNALVPNLKYKGVSCLTVFLASLPLPTRKKQRLCSFGIMVFSLLVVQSDKFEPQEVDAPGTLFLLAVLPSLRKLVPSLVLPSMLVSTSYQKRQENVVPLYASDDG